MSGLTFQDNFHIIAKRGDNYVNFQVARQDRGSVANKQFNGWISSDGNYILMERDSTDNNDVKTKYFFAKASTQSFQDAWDDRENKAYVDYDSIFS